MVGEWFAGEDRNNLCPAADVGGAEERCHGRAADQRREISVRRSVIHSG